ncbi:MAG: hypothetical protein KY475_27520 [Planctomycetes bacterium]|nr:hypothetical protein [Planctomycetota bacterium]
MCAVPFVAAAALGDERIERRRAQLLDEMRSLAEQTQVAYADGGGKVELRPNPVFRYDDQPRRFIDATLWVWTDAGRPVALQKIEAKYHLTTGEPQWGYCFASLTERRVAVEWPGGITYRSTAPGVAFRDLPDAPPVAERSATRRRQLRAIARRFSARIVMDAKNDITQSMRLLPTPVVEYADESDLLQGAAFGFAATGTNPDLVILVDAGGEGGAPRYRYAPARMTSGGLIVTYEDRVVWEVPWVNWDEAPFPTWTFFATPRTPVPDE